MEQAEVARIINSFKAIKGYFDTTRKYMPQIAKLVVFIEEIIPLLNNIQTDLHQSTALIPKATEKLGKVTSATEMATTEVMDIVDAVIERLNRMTAAVDALEEGTGDAANDEQKAHFGQLREEIDGSQDDLFSIMNALQFQDITTQQINAIGETIDAVHLKLNDLLRGFQEEGISLRKVKQVAYDPEAEFDFNRSAESQEMADMLLKGSTAGKDGAKNDDADADSPEPADDSAGTMGIVIGPDGQPDISMIMNELNGKKADDDGKS